MQVGGTVSLPGFPGLMTGVSAGLMPGIPKMTSIPSFIEIPSKVICLSQVMASVCLIL